MARETFEQSFQRARLASMGFEEAKAAQQALEDESTAAGDALRAFPRIEAGIIKGLVPDAVKATPEYKTAKARSDQAFAKLRAFNEFFTKRFKTELQEERRKRRGG